jgi:hypothetical protein
LVHERGRSTEAIVEAVDRQRRVLTVVPQDERRAVTVGDVNPARGANRRSEDLADTFQPNRLAEWFAGFGFQPGQDVLVMAQEIECIAVEERRPSDKEFSSSNAYLGTTGKHLG